ncbi:MAG: hypothetical protein RL385_3917 [Pseudomonadota bacterium]|jgi:predicted naringenin-chalcone synthase
MTTAYINKIAVGTPAHDIHGAFVRFARASLAEPCASRAFDRFVDRAGIARRFSVLPPAEDACERAVDARGVYTRGAFPTTAERMGLYEIHAKALAAETVQRLLCDAESTHVTHLIVTSCTGMYAPGLDLELCALCQLRSSVERTMVGFMGCYAAINALKLSRHIVRSSPDARVLIVKAVDAGLALDAGALGGSRDVLRDFGNMSSATVMFVLERLLANGRAGQLGFALAFGPGLTTGSMSFQKV